MRIVAVGGSTIATILIGAYGMRVARTTSDFFVASRTVRPMWNASAISGEYLSAASFLGVAGLVMKYGVDMLWYPVGFAAGYLVLRLATTFVLLIGWLYLLPQLKGAGVTLRAILGTPYWVGVVVVGSVITANVALGGMKGIPFVQAFQYWVKVTAIAFPAMALLAHYGADDSPRLTRASLPVFRTETTVRIDVDARFDVTQATPVTVDGRLDGQKWDGATPVDLEPGRHVADAGTTIVFPAGAPVPHHVGLPP